MTTTMSRRRKGVLTRKECVIQRAFYFIALSSPPTPSTTTTTSSLSTVSEIFSNGNEVFHFSTSTSAQFKTFAFTLPSKNKKKKLVCVCGVYARTMFCIPNTRIQHPNGIQRVKKNRSSASSTNVAAVPRPPPSKTHYVFASKIFQSLYEEHLCRKSEPTRFHPLFAVADTYRCRCVLNA